MFKKISFVLICSLVFSFLSFVKPVAAATSINLSPSSGYTSSSFTIGGSEFTADLGVTVTWDGNSLGGGTAGGTGNISFSKTVPGDATVGSHTVTVTSASISKLDKKTKWAWIKKVFAAYQQQPPSASATFTVTATPTTSLPTPTPTPTTSSPTPTSSSTPTSTSSASSTPSSSSPPSSSTTQTDLSNTTAVKGTASSVDKSKSKIEVDKTQVTADGKDVVTISLVLMDSKSRIIEGLSPTISVSGTDNTLSAVEYKDKKYVATLTSTKVEGKTISATVGTVSPDPVSVQFVAPVTATPTPSTSVTTAASAGKCSGFWHCYWWLIIISLIILFLITYMYYKRRKALKNL